MGDTKAESAVDRYRRTRAERLAGPPRMMDPAPPLSEDALWRGLSREGELRFLIARTSAAVGESTRRLGCSGEAGRIVAELLTAALLVRSTLDPESQLQISIQNPGSAGRLLADVWPGERGMRATLARPSAVSHRDGPLLAEGLMHVRRGRGSGEPYRSATRFLARGLEATLMEYLLGSEQILAHLRVECAMRGDAVESCAGFLVQVTPEGTRADLERLVENLDTLPPLESAMSVADPDAREWAGRLLTGFRWDQCAREKVAFVCRCSRDRVVAALASLPKADLLELSAGGIPTETVCEFCNETYRIPVSELRGLLEPS